MVIASPVSVSSGLTFTATSVFVCRRRMVDSGNDRIVRTLDVNVISGCCDCGECGQLTVDCSRLRERLSWLELL